MAIVAGDGLAPTAALNRSDVGAAIMIEFWLTTSVTATVRGDPVAPAEDTPTLAEYVPMARPAGLATKVSMAGALVDERVAESQGAG